MQQDVHAAMLAQLVPLRRAEQLRAANLVEIVCRKIRRLHPDDPLLDERCSYASVRVLLELGRRPGLPDCYYLTVAGRSSGDVIRDEARAWGVSRWHLRHSRRKTWAPVSLNDR